MIYIKNTTDAQVIYIDRETQSIDNITPITLDSNYYNKVEVDAIAQGTLEQSKEYTNNLANEYYDIAEEYIDSNIEKLENRIDELENNGGGSSGGGKESVVIDLGVTTEPNLTKEQIIEIADNFLSKKYTIKYVDTDDANTDYQLRLIDIIAVNDTREGDDPAKYVELVGVTININIEFLKWRFQQGSFNISDSITLEKESISKIVWEYLVPLMSNVSNLETKATDIENRAFNNVDSLENQIKENTDRLDTLENNGGGSSEGNSSVVRITAIDETISVEDFNRIYDNTNNEVFEICLQYTNKEDYTIITIIKKESIPNYGIKNIVGYDDTTIYKWLNYSFDNNIYLEKSSLLPSYEENETTYFVDEESGHLDKAQFYHVIDIFEEQRVVFRTSDGDVNIVCVDNSTIIGIIEDYMIIWSNISALERIDKRKISLGGDTTNLQNQIEANTTRINEVERVRVLDVLYGMTTEQFNVIFDKYKTMNYKYLLNVGNNDLFEICSIQTTNRSITAIGFDDYEGQMMCYTWFAPQRTSVPELTKRKIITEIV